MCAVCFVYYILTNPFKNKTIEITTKLKCNNGCISTKRLKGKKENRMFQGFYTVREVIYTLKTSYEE